MRTSQHVVIMAQVMPVAVSPTGEYFAYSSPDGTLKLWETATGTIKQEYTPSSHLSATCTCLAWGPSSKSNVSTRWFNFNQGTPAATALPRRLGLLRTGGGGGGGGGGRLFDLGRAVTKVNQALV